MNGLDISDEQIEHLRLLPDSGPVIMANYCKYRELSVDGAGTGRDAYRRYSSCVIPLLKERGGNILWAGNVEAVALGLLEDGDWIFCASTISEPSGFHRYDDLS